MRPELSGKPLVFVVGAFAHGKVRRRWGPAGQCGRMGERQTQRLQGWVAGVHPGFRWRAYWALIARPSLSSLPSQPQIDDSYVDEYISISQFPLSAAYALGRITNALERKWGIV